MAQQPSLKRVLSLPQLVLYGLGTTIGAGIYALVGELAAVAGYSALASFVLAAFMAGLTALSFAELCGRFPRAGGAAVYVREGLGSLRLSTLVGVLVVMAGLVSSSALVNALVSYINVYIELPRLMGVIIFAVLLGAIAIWGIAESVTIAGIITVVEIGGLVVVIWVSRHVLNQPFEQWEMLLEGFRPAHWGVVGAGALLAFYAFIGFEDMVVVAEEVKGVKLTLPLAILLTLLITSLLYLTIMAQALLTFTPAQLASSAAPLVDLYSVHRHGAERLPGSGWGISVVAMFAIINGALIQIIMASRVMYGLADRGQLPPIFGRVNARTRTPLFATVVATVIVLVLAAIGRLATLAEITSVIMLTVFALANLSLWRIKATKEQADLPFCFPRWVPGAGFLISLCFVLVFVVDVVRHG